MYVLAFDTKTGSGVNGSGTSRTWEHTVITAGSLASWTVAAGVELGGRLDATAMPGEGEPGGDGSRGALAEELTHPTIRGIARGGPAILTVAGTVVGDTRVT